MTKIKTLTGSQRSGKTFDLARTFTHRMAEAVKSGNRVLLCFSYKRDLAAWVGEHLPELKALSVRYETASTRFVFQNGAILQLYVVHEPHDIERLHGSRFAIIECGDIKSEFAQQIQIICQER